MERADDGRVGVSRQKSACGDPSYHRAPMMPRAGTGSSTMPSCLSDLEDLLFKFPTRLKAQDFTLTTRRDADVGDLHDTIRGFGRIAVVRRTKRGVEGGLAIPATKGKERRFSFCFGELFYKASYADSRTFAQVRLPTLYNSHSSGTDATSASLPCGKPAVLGTSRIAKPPQFVHQTKPVGCHAPRRRGYFARQARQIVWEHDLVGVWTLWA